MTTLTASLYVAVQALQNHSNPDDVDQGRGIVMARPPAGFPGGVRISDYLTVNVIAQVYPHDTVREVLRLTDSDSLRRRDLPAEVMVYYVIAMALFRAVSAREVLRCLVDGLRLSAPGEALKVSGKSSISRARGRLGLQPFAALRTVCVTPLAGPDTRGARHRSDAST